MLKTLLSFILYFSIISANSQTVTAEEVKNNAGKIVTVSGKVASGSYLPTAYRQPTFLNIDKPFPGEIFTVVIYGESRKAFGYTPEETLLGQSISVTGKVTMYYGKPQIEVTKPEQIVFATAPAKPQIAQQPRAATTGEAKAVTTGEVVLRSSVKLKSGPGLDYKDVSKLKPGTVVKVIYTEEGWSYVSVTKNQGKKDLNEPMTGFIKSVDLK
jgi:hypothetical protein